MSAGLYFSHPACLEHDPSLLSPGHPDTPARLMQACQHIAREIRSGYTIGYLPPDRDGAYHRVRVDVRPPDGRRISVRTRPGYFAASPVTQP